MILNKYVLKSRRSSGFLWGMLQYTKGRNSNNLRRNIIMLKKYVAKMLVALFIFASVFTVNTLAGENDIPRMFRSVAPIYQVRLMK